MSEDRTELDETLDLRVMDQRSLVHVDLDQETAPAVILTFGSSAILVVPVTPDDDAAVVDIQAFHEGRPSSNLMAHRITR